MSHNLHNVNGWLIVGIDGHWGFHIFPPMPMWFWKLNLLHPFTLGDKAKPTVLFDGVPSVTHFHSPQFLWPHIGISPDPLDALTPLHVAFGVQRCWMPRTRILINNEVAACCLMPGCFSVNSDCWCIAGDANMVPSSLVINPCTVVTNPQWYDFMLGAMSVALDNSFLGPFVGAALGIWDWFDRATHRDCDCESLQANVPEGPPGVDIDANIQESMAMRDRPLPERLTWFWAKVQTGGDWDYKKYGGRYEDFGNFHFGVIGRAIGLPENFLERGAGAFQIISNTSQEGWGTPLDLGQSSYGDQPRDQEMMQRGFDYFYCR